MNSTMRILSVKQAQGPMRSDGGTFEIKAEVMVSEHISTLTIVKFVADKLEAFPNSEERTILLQKMKQEHMHNIRCLDSVVGLLHDFPKLAARQPGSVRFFAKKAKESTNAQFIEEHENLRRS